MPRMTSPAGVVRRLLPEIDERAWIMVMAIGAFAVLGLKETPLSATLVLGLFAAGVVGSIAAGWLGPEVPLYALIAYLPFSGLLAGGASIPFLNLTNLLVLLIVVSHIWRQRRQRLPVLTPAPMNAVIVLFGALAVLSLMRAGWMYGGWYASAHTVALLRWLRPMAFYFVALWVVRDARALKTVLALIAVAVTVVALMALWEYLDRAGSTIERSRVQGIAGEANRMGAFFVTYMFLFLGYFFVTPLRRYGWLMLVPFLLCVRGIMVTFSRGAHVAFAAGVLVACWMRSKWLFVVAAAAAAFIITHPALLPGGFRTRIEQTIRPGQRLDLEAGASQELSRQLEPSVGRRVEAWNGGLAMVRAHPWVGVGFGGFRRFIPHYTQGRVSSMAAHNTYLWLAAEMGIPTLLVFLLFLDLLAYHTVWLYRHSRDVWLRALGLGVLAGVAALSVANGFSECLDSSEEVVGYFWILCALVMRGVLLEKQETTR